jgi:hypothetical protein
MTFPGILVFAVGVTDFHRYRSLKSSFLRPSTVAKTSAFDRWTRGVPGVTGRGGVLAALVLLWTWMSVGLVWVFWTIRMSPGPEAVRGRGRGPAPVDSGSPRAGPLRTTPCTPPPVLLPTSADKRGACPPRDTYAGHRGHSTPDRPAAERVDTAMEQSHSASPVSVLKPSIVRQPEAGDHPWLRSRHLLVETSPHASSCGPASPRTGRGWRRR